jgi:hypothetical protein
MVNYIKSITKTILRPFVRPLLERIRLITREEMTNALETSLLRESAHAKGHEPPPPGGGTCRGRLTGSGR